MVWRPIRPAEFHSLQREDKNVKRIRNLRIAQWPVFLLVAGLLAGSPRPCRAGDVFLTEVNTTAKTTFTIDFPLTGTPDKLPIDSGYSGVVIPFYMTPDMAFTLTGLGVLAANSGGIGFIQGLGVTVTDTAGVLGEVSLRYTQGYVLSPFAQDFSYTVMTGLTGTFAEAALPLLPHENDVFGNTTLTYPGFESQSTPQLEAIDRSGPAFALARTDFNFAALLFVKVNNRFDFEGTPAAGDSITIPFTANIEPVPEPSTVALSGPILALWLLAPFRRRSVRFSWRQRKPA
jgi:hypothetical protein